jgi:hypothetical protein
VQKHGHSFDDIERERTMQGWRIASLAGVLVAVFGGGSGCGPVVNEYNVDQPVLAFITEFRAIDDSSFRDNIRVEIKGRIGPTTAYSFERIAQQQTDSVYHFAVWGRHNESSKEQYTLKDILVDTIVTFQTQRLGMLYLVIYGSNTNFVDSTFVY